jgi:hypothetical protein
MDEHIKVAGATVDFRGDLIDDNLNSLTWWTEKHNRYASREAVDLLNLEYGFMPHDSVASLRGRSQAGSLPRGRGLGDGGKDKLLCLRTIWVRSSVR